MNGISVTREDTAELGERLRAHPRIAFDAEGDGFFRYAAKLCTVQLASADEIGIVDTLAVPAITLAPLLGDDGPEKVVHDAAFDVRLLRDAGVRFGRLFDTSIAARYLGEPATGLASLVAKHFGVTLSKEQQQADWGARPIDAHSVLYLEDDVRHLLPLAELLEAACREAGIEAEVREECAWVVSSALAEAPDDRPPWVRIKGAADLPAVGRSVLREVALVRDKNARRLDVAPFRVAPDAVLLELARTRPPTLVAALALRGLGKGRARRLAPDLLAAVRLGEAREAPPAHEDERLRRPAPPPEVQKAQKRRKGALTAFRAAAAKERGVDVQVVLPGHCMAELAHRGAESTVDLAAIPGLGEARIARYGEKLLATLSQTDAR